MSYPHIYIHVPFCGRRCSYCDFAIAVRRDVPVARFNDAIMAELVTRRIELDPGLMRSVYLGGGTPSKLGGSGVAQLLHGIAAHAGVEKLPTPGVPVEVTLEANPEDVTREAARAWVAAGVNRVSLGVQSFHESVLTWMHRGHGADGPGRAVEILRDEGIENLSVDLIFALPSVLDRDWSKDLDKALALSPTHVSLYGLTVEPQTPLGRWRARGAVEEAPEERYETEYLEAHRALTAAGFEHYEVSNFGLPGRHSLHNSAYWSGASYLGLGPSAHGFDAGVRRWNLAAYAAWDAAVGAGRDPIEGHETLGPGERSAEEVYLGLRTNRGLDIRGNELETVTPWIEAGWGRLAGHRLTLTAEGWLRLDALAATLTSLRSRS